MNEITRPTYPQCPKCEQSRYVVKAGSNRGGSQRLRCQMCKSYFTPKPKSMGYDPKIREQALCLYLEGSSLRSIGRILHVHHQSVANWVNAAEQQLPQQVADQTPTGTVEIDELYTYIGKKKESVCSSGSIALQQAHCGS